MYLARYGGGDLAFVQAALHFPRAVEEPPAVPDGWWSAFRAWLAQVLACPDLLMGMRLRLRGRNLERVLFLNLPAGREADLERLGRAAASLNTLADGSVVLPETREQHDAVAVGMPEPRWQIRPAPGTFRDSVLGSEFRLAPDLEPVLQRALQDGCGVEYQANLRSMAAAPEALRWLRRNCLRLESEAVPPRVLETQQRLADRLAGGEYGVEEHIAGDGVWVASLVEEHYARRMGRLGFPGPALSSDLDSDCLSFLDAGFHHGLFEELHPLELASGALTRDEAAELLGWRPSPMLERSLEGIRLEGEPNFLERIERRLARLENTLRTRHRSAPECEEVRKAVGIGAADPPFALAKARQILERLVLRIYQDQKPGAKEKPLFNMIEELTEVRDLFPPNVSTFLHSVRVIGNYVVHPRPGQPAAETLLSEADVEVTLLMILSVIEWYLLEYHPPGPEGA